MISTNPSTAPIGLHAPVGLRCEMLMNPLGVEFASPLLSWQGCAATRQTAYRIEVMDDTAGLHGEATLLWDSGLVNSQQSTHVRYQGRTLVSRQRCKWRVKVWDQMQQESAWSDWARWEMGLLLPGDWTARWIGRDGVCAVDWRAQTLPAPYFRKSFVLPSNCLYARLYVCGLGFHEVYLNGQRVCDHVLSPAPTQFDRRARYRVHDVTAMLRCGENTVGAVLGNGWYNPNTAEVWHFDKAPWRDYPKLLLQLEMTGADGVCRTIETDGTWRIGDGPIRFDALRNGEHYDARLANPAWAEPGFDDAQWREAACVPGPGGLLTPELAPPCRVVKSIHAVRSWIPRTGVRVFDFGQNLAGWARLELTGSSGQSVVLRYGERLNNHGEVDQSHIGGFIKSGETQTDHYTSASEKSEVWEPRFTYHGFEYVQVEAPEQMLAQLDIQACVVHTDFEQVGMFECSNPVLNRLHQATMWSYRSNFVGIPTDCPHREKNGWTGDAHLAAEAGLLHFDASSAYAEWLESVVDAQRTNGQLPGIVPTAGWGYNWGSGPAWDSALLLIPWYIYLYTGNQRCIERYYPAMARYVGYCASLASEGIIQFGLGDWCHPDSKRAAPAALTSTAYLYQNALLLARFARLTGRGDEALLHEQLAQQTRAAFQQAFYRGDGIYAEGQATAQACALYHGLAEESDRPQVARQLALAVGACEAKAVFGILGAKYVPRALAEAGYLELAYRLIVQPEYPGWIHWLGQGATTLWENWDGESSRNHVMFGDVAAWMLQYLGGIVADASKPGFAHFMFRPHFVSGLDWVKCSHRSPLGMIESHWQRIEDQVHLELRVPGNSWATLLLPDQKAMTLEAGIHRLNVSTNGTLPHTSEPRKIV